MLFVILLTQFEVIGVLDPLNLEKLKTLLRHAGEQHLSFDAEKLRFACCHYCEWLFFRALVETFDLHIRVVFLKVVIPKNLLASELTDLQQSFLGFAVVK